MALPRDYPAYVPGFEVVRITVEAAGCAHVLQLLVPPQHGRRRPRSDQFAAIEDGAAWPKFGTRTQASAWVAKILPRLFSRDELAMMG